MRIAFGGFKQVDAVLFTAGFGDTTQIETMAELLEIFGNDLRPAAKKIAVITYCEKMPDEAVLEQYKEHSDFNKIYTKLKTFCRSGPMSCQAKAVFIVALNMLRTTLINFTVCCLERPLITLLNYGMKPWRW